MIGVFSFRTSSNSSVSAALPWSCSSSGVVSFSACDDVPSQPQNLFQELAAVVETLLVTFLSFSSRSPSSTNLGLPACFVESGDQLHCDPFGSAFRFLDRFDQVGVHDQFIEIVADRFQVRVFVNQLNRLGAEGVPEQLAVSAGGFYGLVNLAQPAVVGFVRRQA